MTDRSDPYIPSPATGPSPARDAAREVDAFMRWILNEIETNGETPTTDQARISLFHSQLDDAAKAWLDQAYGRSCLGLGALRHAQSNNLRRTWPNVYHVLSAYLSHLGHANEPISTTASGLSQNTSSNVPFESVASATAASHSSGFQRFAASTVQPRSHLVPSQAFVGSNVSPSRVAAITEILSAQLHHPAKMFQDVFAYLDSQADLDDMAKCRHLEYARAQYLSLAHRILSEALANSSTPLPQDWDQAQRDLVQQLHLPAAESIHTVSSRLQDPTASTTPTTQNPIAEVEVMRQRYSASGTEPGALAAFDMRKSQPRDAADETRAMHTSDDEEQTSLRGVPAPAWDPLDSEEVRRQCQGRPSDRESSIEGPTSPGDHSNFDHHDFDNIPDLDLGQESARDLAESEQESSYGRDDGFDPVAASSEPHGSESPELIIGGRAPSANSAATETSNAVVDTLADDDAGDTAPGTDLALPWSPARASPKRPPQKKGKNNYRQKLQARRQFKESATGRFAKRHQQLPDTTADTEDPSPAE